MADLIKELSKKVDKQLGGNTLLGELHQKINDELAGNAPPLRFGPTRRKKKKKKKVSKSGRDINISIS